MILNLICQQPAADPPRVDLLDFCMEHMISREEPAGVQSLCMKLAYQLTRSIPELQQELRTMLEANKGGISDWGTICGALYEMCIRDRFQGLRVFW